MKRKSVSEILGQVDPNLKVIPGGIRRRRNRNNAIKLDEVSYIELPTYIPRRMNENDWNDAGGAKCPICGQEVERLIRYGFSGQNKACEGCLQRRRELADHKAMIAKFRSPRGR